jgi:hypothetical protein
MEAPVAGVKVVGPEDAKVERFGLRMGEPLSGGWTPPAS